MDGIYKNILDKIINDRKGIIDVIIKIYKLFDDLKLNNDYENNFNEYCKFISSINFYELNSYCGCGNFPKDEYIFHHYYKKLNRNNRLYKKAYQGCFSYNDLEKLDISQLIRIMYQKVEGWYNLKSFDVFFTLFSTNEEIFDKNFNLLIIKHNINYNLREHLITNLLNLYFKYSVEYFNINADLKPYRDSNNLSLKILNEFNKNYLQEQINFLLFVKKVGLHKINLQGDLFLDFLRVFQEIIYNNEYDLKHKIFYFDICINIFFDILQTIIYMLFIPFNFIFNNRYLQIYINNCGCKLFIQVLYKKKDGAEYVYFYN